jgi:competence protein ComFC
MQAVIRALLDLVFPPGKAEEVVRALGIEELRKLCVPQVHNGTTFLLPYRDPRVRALIWQLKYKRDRKAVALLSLILKEYLETHVPESCLVIPIPLSRTRLHERGYNQVTLITRELTRAFPRLTLREDILVRTLHRERQTTLGRQERLQNIRGSLCVLHPETLSGKDVLILDDVTTTGATLREAEAVLQTAKPRSVRMIALAH